MRKHNPWLLILALTGCGVDAALPVQIDPTEQVSGGKADKTGAIPDVTCDSPPPFTTEGWRHGFKSPLATAFGTANHRGIDLVASASQAQQLVSGEIKYVEAIDIIEKSLEDEYVEVFACRSGAWQSLGRALTDDNGNFQIALSGAARLPVGIRSMFVSVLGDGSAVEFLAMVLPDGDQVFISDVDGTLTSSENAFPDSLVKGIFTDTPVAFNEGAPAALTALQGRNYHPIYVTSRGRVFTGVTRNWLSSNGFPRGALRLNESAVTLPGAATSQYKSDTFKAIVASGITPKIGIGNRATDAAAYKTVDLDGQHIFLKLPEFQDEDGPVIAAGGATGFTSYVDLSPTFQAEPVAP